MSDYVEDNVADLAPMVDITPRPTTGPGAIAEVSWWGQDRANFFAAAITSIRNQLKTGLGMKARSRSSLIPTSSGEVSWGSVNGQFAKNENAGADVAVGRWDSLARSASAGAYSPPIKADTVIDITLDADLTLNNPTLSGFANTAKAGCHLVLLFTQDATGYRRVTWGSNFSKASFIMPRQGPSQTSSVHLVQRTDGTWRVVSHDAINTRQDIWVEDFGADPTGVADSWKAIQMAIDTSIYIIGAAGAHPDVRAGGGAFKTSDTIHLGYGETLRCVRFRGSGMGSRGELGYGGTAIQPTFSDRPCINVAGGRNSMVSDIAVIGKLVSWIESNHLANSADFVPELDPLIDDTDPASWVDPGLAATQDGRYTPYCGLSTDAYQGTAPVGSGNQYPNVTFTSISGVSGQYNKAPSGNTKFVNVGVRGFNTCFVATPSGSDGNGDFPTFENCIFEEFKWGFSISHTQCRNVSLKNVQFNTGYCLFTNRTHGLQRGKFGGSWTDCSAGQVIKVFDFGSLTIGGPIVATNFYAEALWRIGDYDEAASNTLSLSFVGGQFSFTLQNNRRGIPATVMGPTNQPGCIAFTRCDFDAYPSVMVIDEVGVELEDCTYHPAARDAGTNAAYKALAHNCLTGGLVLGYAQSANANRSARFTQFNIDNVIAGGGSTVSPSGNAVAGNDFNSINRPYCMPFYMREARTAQDDFRNPLFNPQANPHPWDSSSFSSMTLTGRELTIVHSSLADESADIYGMMPGDVLVDSANKTVYFIHSRSTTTVLATAQNNYKLVGGVETVPALPSGYLYAINSRFYSPGYLNKGDTTSGSATIANVARGDGYAGYLTTEVKVGDRFFIDEFSDLPFYNSASKVTAVTAGSPGSIVLTAGALRSQTGLRLAWFLRAAPANV